MVSVVEVSTYLDIYCGVGVMRTGMDHDSHRQSCRIVVRKCGIGNLLLIKFNNLHVP